MRMSSLRTMLRGGPRVAPEAPGFPPARRVLFYLSSSFFPPAQAPTPEKNTAAARISAHDCKDPLNTLSMCGRARRRPRRINGTPTIQQSTPAMRRIASMLLISDAGWESLSPPRSVRDVLVFGNRASPSSGRDASRYKPPEIPAAVSRPATFLSRLGSIGEGPLWDGRVIEAWPSGSGVGYATVETARQGFVLTCPAVTEPTSVIPGPPSLESLSPRRRSSVAPCLLRQRGSRSAAAWPPGQPVSGS
jgi:hypothetical protein